MLPILDPWFDKQGMSTALVRNVLKGGVSPANVQRAAGAMQPGQFRYLNNLGRGQTAIADRVVGNLGNEAGEFVRKLPTRHVPSVASQYQGTADEVTRLNKAFGYQPEWRANPKSPVHGSAELFSSYPHVSDRGAFQRMATGQVKYPQGKAVMMEQLSNAGVGDLHAGNVGPGGQIFDYATVNSPVGASSDIHSMLRRPLIEKSTARYGVFGGADGVMDVAANGESVGTGVQQIVQRQNNAIRKHWAMPAASRPYEATLHASQPAQVSQPRPPGQLSQSQSVAPARGWSARPSQPPVSLGGNFFNSASQPAPAKPGLFNLLNRWFGRKAG